MADNPLTGRAATLKRAVTLRRYENQLSADVVREIKSGRDQLVGLLAGQDPTTVSAGRVQARLDSLAKKATDVLDATYTRVRTLSRRELYGVGQAGAQGSANEITRAAAAAGVEVGDLALPTPNQLRAIVSFNPVQGAVAGDWWARQERATVDAFRTTIQQGMTRGDSLATLIQRVRGTSIGGGRFAGGIIETSTRNATTLVRTAVNEVYNQAAADTYQQNDDVLQGVEFVAVIDERTCPECADLDGTTYALDDPALDGVTPPLHFNCRCALVPVLDYSALGVSTPPSQDRQTYPQWFDDQPAATQNAILGPSKAALVRSGKATFSDLVRGDGSMATLAEVQANL